MLTIQRMYKYALMGEWTQSNPMTRALAYVHARHHHMKDIMPRLGMAMRKITEF